MKSYKVAFFILCDVIFLVRLQETLKLITLGIERVKPLLPQTLCVRKLA